MYTPLATGNFMKSFVSMQQSAIQSSFQLIGMMQDQAESTLQSAWKVIPGVPEQGLALVDDWFESMRAGRDALKKAIDEGLNRLVETIE